MLVAVLFMVAASSVLRADENTLLSGTECPKKVSVLVETVKASAFMDYQYFSGQGKAAIIVVTSPVAGMLSEIKVSEGSLVDADQDLVVLNAGMSEEIKKLTADVANKKKTLTTRQSWKVKNEKAVQVAARDYQKALDLLNEKKAQANLIIKAPVAGIVHLVLAVNSELAVDALLLEISNPKQMIFQIPLADGEKGTLAIGDRFSATGEGLSTEVEAEVVALSDAQVTFRVNNDENQVKEGVNFIFKKLKSEYADVIVIPSLAVQKDGLGTFVYVVEKKKAKKLYVTVGAAGSGKTMIEKGLAAGSEIVVSGFDCISDGKKINSVNQDELAKEKAEALAKKEADLLAAKKAEAQAKEEAEAKVQKKAEALAKKEAEALAKKEADLLASEKADAQAKEKAEAKAQKKAEALAKKEAEAQAKLKEKEATQEEKAVEKTECPKKVAVTVEKVKTELFLEFQFSSRGQAEVVAVKSPVSGLLSEIKVSEGSLVDAGQDLVVLNAGMGEEIKKLTAEAAKAKKILTTRQNSKVKNEKAIQAATQDYQKALDLLNEKKAKADQVVKAPVSGIVHLVVAAGSETAANALLLEISNPRQMLFPISLTDSDKGLLTIGDKFVGTTDGFSGEVAAEVVAVSETQAVFGVNNTENQVKEGVIFTFKKLGAEHPDAIVIPTSAIQHDSLGDFVYVAEKKKAKKQYITLGKSRAGKTMVKGLATETPLTGKSGEGKTMVLKGLSAETPLIISGFECLADSKKIRIVNQEELAKEKAEVLVKVKEKAATEEENKVTKQVVKTEVAEAKKTRLVLKNRFRVGLIFGRFSINDKNLRSFYLNWFKNIPGIEFSFNTVKNVDFWLSYKIFSEKLTTTFYGNELKFKLAPLSIGLRYRFPKWRFVEPFVGAGINYYAYSETITGESDLEDTMGKAFGFHFQGGSYFDISQRHNISILGEIFLKYNLVKKTLVELLPDGTDQLDLGGFEFGIGLGVKF
ncbi:MAG: biotin/lipoyl-binding protein [Candidatus Aminicenantes bacterium]|nr:biotin/lipoyl-binding protein [Candidatus Aminicenantes bacterium]